MELYGPQSVTLPPSYNDITTQARSVMTTQLLAFTPNDFHRCTFHNLEYTSCIQHLHRYYAPQQYVKPEKSTPGQQIGRFGASTGQCHHRWQSATHALFHYLCREGGSGALDEMTPDMVVGFASDALARCRDFTGPFKRC